MSSTLVFEKYQIIRRLAVGGMGEIFLAKESGAIERLVILKALLPDLAEDESSVRDFLDEARVAGTLSHPNIVNIYEAGPWEGSYFIAMEFVDGENVHNLMVAASKANLRIPFSVSARIVHDAALALHHAHTAVDGRGESLKVVHRDVSPQNIMVRRDGVTKVLDFGIARAAIRSQRTATGVLKGKLRYMPPEQLRGDELDGRSDEYSLGIVLWELVAGRRLFPSDMQLSERLQDRPAPPLSEIVEGVPPDIERIATRMLQNDPANRYASCAMVAQDLSAFLRESADSSADTEVSSVIHDLIGERKLGDLSPQESFLLSLSGRETTSGAHWTKRLLIGLVVIAALAGGLLFFLRKGPAPVASLAVKGPAGATIEVDGAKWRYPAPTVVDGLTPGIHRVTLTAEGRKPWMERVDLAAGANTLDTSDWQAPVKAPTLTITSNPSGAQVWMGSTSLGTTPLETQRLAPGQTHALRIEKHRFVAQAIEVALKPGEAKSEHVALVRQKRTRRSPPPPPPRAVAPPPQPKAPGSITIDTKPWTKVRIDGKTYGVTPLFRIELEPGKHKVQLVNDNAGINEVRTVTIKPGKSSKLKLNLTK